MYFGQLLGMADHLSFSLGRAGFRAHKILPYGPVPETLQYLLRRAQENSDFGGGCAKEARGPLTQPQPLPARQEAACSPGRLSSACECCCSATRV